MPEIILLLKTKYRISSGKSVKAIAAKVQPQATFPYSPTKSFNPNGMVLILVLSVKVLANTNSFHTEIKFTVATVIMVFLDKGK